MMVAAPRRRPAAACWLRAPSISSAGPSTRVMSAGAAAARTAPGGASRPEKRRVAGEMVEQDFEHLRLQFRFHDRERDVGFFLALARMGARLETVDERLEGGETVGTLVAAPGTHPTDPSEPGGVDGFLFALRQAVPNAGFVGAGLENLGSEG